MPSVKKQGATSNLKMFAVLAGAIFTLIAVLVGADWYFPSDICHNKVIAEYPSPNGQKKIVLFQRECGATVGFNTQASVIDSGETIGNDEANLLVADNDHGAASSKARGGPILRLVWENNSNISISHHPKIRFFKSEESIQNIKIQYMQLS